MVAKKPFSGIKIQVLYDFGANTIYFDGIQLYKEEFGNSYTYNDKGNVTSVKDLQGQTTQYEYASNNTDLLRVIQDNKAKVTYTYDDYHNVKTATTEEGIVYEFEYDAYGNNTSVSIGSGDTKITSIAEYTDDFNRLEATTNAQGRKTLYGYHPDTNVLEWVQYPMDTAATRTEYTYDEMYRTAQAALTTDTGLALSAEYTYDNDLLMSIETASTTYDFAYGNFALRSSVDIGNWNLAEYSYESGTNRLLKLDYGNGDKVQYTYDDQGRVTKQTYEDNAYVTYKYDNSGALATVYDSETSTTSTYYYDFTDRMMKYAEKSSTGTHAIGYTYDDINNLTALVETVGNQEYTTSYSYDGDNRLTSLESDNVFQSYTYDAYGRVTQKTAKNGDQTVIDEAITYRNAGPGGITAQPFQLIYTGTNYSTTFGYGYNTNDNIVYVNQDGNTTYYYYDSANQLIREDNSTTDTTTLWTYDAAGNILRREVYPFSGAVPDPDAKISQVEYTYGDSDWGDLLTEYNGVEITYDGIGNPVNDGTWTYTWQHGRQLASMAKIDQSETWQFTYNADGLRTQRTNGTTTYKYTYLGGQLTHMTVDGHTMYFAYDASGVPLAMTYDGVDYYYVTNIQEDVVSILNASGTEVVHYAYDAWGKVQADGSATNLRYYNPLRYRGYVYDEETKLHYLQSRYYNPEIGRFINADGYAATGQGVLGNNVFAYCNNNPIMMIDESGNCPHNGRFYTSGPFKGQFEYDPDCDLCYNHTEFWVHDAYGNWYNLWKHEVHEFDQMAMCTDGGDNSYNSNSHQKETAYSIKNEYMEPTRIKYVVAPVGYDNVKNGDLALVIDRATGNSLFAIVGDRGPKGKHNEVSLRVAWDLGYSWADGSMGPRGDFQIVYFPDTNHEWKSLSELENFLN